MTEVSQLYQHLCSPHEGHVNYVYKIFRYLQNSLSNNTGRVAFYTYCVPTGKNVFQGSTREFENWKNFYPDTSEAQTREKL